MSNDKISINSIDGAFLTRFPVEIDGNQIVVSTFLLSIPQFKALYDRDKTKDKQKALNEFCYIIHCNDVRSPYRELEQSDREQTLINEYLEGKQADRLIVEAAEKYKSLCETRNIKLLKSAYAGCDKLMDYFTNVDINEVDEKGALINKPTDLTRNLKEVGAIVESLKKLESMVKQDMDYTKSRIRGNVEVTEWEQ